MRHFVNPHAGYPVQHHMPQNQPPMLDRGYNPHMQMPQHPAQMRPPGVVQLQNGMLMLPDGTILTPQQFMALQQQQSYQNQPMPNSGRFGNTSEAVMVNISSAQGVQVSADTARFHNTQVKHKDTPMEQVQLTFNVNARKMAKCGDSSNVVYSTHTDEVKTHHVASSKDNVVVTSCFQEAVENLIEHAYLQNNQAITLQESIVTTSFYKTMGQAEFNKIICTNDVKTLYKALKVVGGTLSTKYDINLFKELDTIITDEINDYVKAYGTVDVSIDSFSLDFNDLLKVIRNNEEDLEDSLVTHLTKFIGQLTENDDVAHSTDEDTPNDVTYLSEAYQLCYVDKFSYELGISDVPANYALIEQKPSNTFLTSLAKLITGMTNVNKLFLVTSDRHIVKLLSGNFGKVFIKSIA